jgi:3-keto-L-gulonate-6-phosphate decarboxylase
MRAKQAVLATTEGVGVIELLAGTLPEVSVVATETMPLGAAEASTAAGGSAAAQARTTAIAPAATRRTAARGVDTRRVLSELLAASAMSDLHRPKSRSAPRE